MNSIALHAAFSTASPKRRQAGDTLCKGCGRPVQVPGEKVPGQAEALNYPLGDSDFSTGVSNSFQPYGESETRARPELVRRLNLVLIASIVLMLLGMCTLWLHAHGAGKKRQKGGQAPAFGTSQTPF